MAKKRIKLWTIAEAQAIYKELEPVTRSHGFILCMCGSVIRDGKGRDLDLVAFPARPTSDRGAMIDGIVSKLETSRPGIDYHGPMGTVSISILSQSRIIDLQIREQQDRN